MEFINTFNPQDAIFGIANVQSKKCHHTIGYFLADRSLTLLLPETCYSCPKASICSKEFGIQVIRKYNQQHKDTELDLHF